MSVLVLMYHGVDERPGPLFVSPSLFDAHLDVIAESGLPVLTMSEIARLAAEQRLPPRAVALTFDDGFASVLEAAAPRIAKRGLCATVFCVAGHLGRTNQWPTNHPDAPPVPLSSAGELPTLAAAGFEIGAHGMYHTPLGTEDRQEIHREIFEARSVLEQAAGRAIQSFAYPYGALPSRAADEAVRQAYTSACTTRIGRVTAAADLVMGKWFEETLPDRTYSSADEVMSALGWETAANADNGEKPAPAHSKSNKASSSAKHTTPAQ